MLGTDMSVAQRLRFLSSAAEDTLRLGRQRKINVGGNLLLNWYASGNLIGDVLRRRVIARETFHNVGIFPQEPQKHVLGLDARAPKSAGLEPAKEDYSSRPFR